MPEDKTVEVPLPEGTIPDQESVITQEIPVAREPFPEIQLVSPVKVELPPLHLINDPIMTMDAPVADNTPLYDQLNPPPLPPLPPRPRRRMKAGDKFLVAVTVGAVGMGTMAYGMVFLGWGAGPVPDEDEAKPHVSVVTTDEPTVLPTTGVPTHRAPSKPPVKVVADPTTYSPTPEASVVVITPTPEASSASETPVETSEAPEPSPTPTKPSTPPPSPTPTPSSPTPTPTQTQSASPSFSIPLPASPTEENRDE